MEEDRIPLERSFNLGENCAETAGDFLEHYLESKPQDVRRENDPEHDNNLIKAAEDYAKRALYHNPQELDYYLLLATIQETRGHHLRARKTLLTAQSTDEDASEDVGLLGRLGRNSYNIKDYKQALFFLRNAYLIDPKEPEIMEMLGHVHTKLRHYNHALRHLHNAESITEPGCELYISMGECYLRIKSPLEACACFTTAVTINQRSVEALCGLAESQARLGATYEAMCAVGSAYEIDPKNKSVEALRMNIGFKRMTERCPIRIIEFKQNGRS